jgi:hypothetical protein
MGNPRPTRRPREGWEDQFRKMHELGDDRLIETPPPSAWDEWEWDSPLTLSGETSPRSVADR